jgi:hypothetical protein
VCVCVVLGERLCGRIEVLRSKLLETLVWWWWAVGRKGERRLVLSDCKVSRDLSQTLVDMDSNDVS